MRRQNKDWNAKKAYEERTKKSAASDEYIHNFRQERKRTAEYDTEQGADLPNSLVKQAKKNQEVNEAASRGEYTTKHRSGQVRTHKLPQEEATFYFQKLIEDPSIPDQIRFPLEQANLAMQNAFQFGEEDATLSYVNAFKAQPETPVPEPNTPINNDNVDDIIENSRDHYLDEINDPDSVRNTEMNRNQGKWSGEVGDRKLNKISPIQEKLIAAGHKEEDLIKLMENNQKFQANRPKVTDLLKIFKK